MDAGVSWRLGCAGVVCDRAACGAGHRGSPSRHRLRPTPPAAPPVSRVAVETFMAKVRALAAEARPPRPAATQIEARIPAGGGAAGGTGGPSPESVSGGGRGIPPPQIADKAHRLPEPGARLDRPATRQPTTRSHGSGATGGFRPGARRRPSGRCSTRPIRRRRNTLGTILQALGQRSRRARRSTKRRCSSTRRPRTRSTTSATAGFWRATLDKAVEACRRR